MRPFNKKLTVSTALLQQETCFEGGALFPSYFFLAVWRCWEHGYLMINYSLRNSFVNKQLRFGRFGKIVQTYFPKKNQSNARSRRRLKTALPVVSRHVTAYPSRTWLPGPRGRKDGRVAPSYT